MPTDVDFRLDMPDLVVSHHMCIPEDSNDSMDVNVSDAEPCGDAEEWANLHVTLLLTTHCIT